jgi:hypothetical protein
MSNPANRSDPAPTQAITGRLKNAKVVRVTRGNNGQLIKAAVAGVIGTAINHRMLIATPSTNRLGDP